ncbi:monocarboxylate transporter 14-like [Liolophura sinensis]|uniref:monocarboxylate transporter 14-like n=1 Tax=Liolophura sinensis TaxID=3198878 RepID=UPI0031584AAC
MKKSHRTEKFMVLFGAFISQLFSAGFANTLGLFYVEFLETFDTSRVQVGWATSICSGLVFGAGLGCCLVCVSSVVAVGHQFGKSRGAASALAVVGTGVGALIFPIIIRELTDYYGWRGAIMILSALMLNTLPAAGMFVTPRETENNKKEGLHLKKALCSSALRKNAGLINDATGSYNISFYIAGCLCFFSVITFATVLKLSKCCGKPQSIEQTMEAIEVEVKEVIEKVTTA